MKTQIGLPLASALILTSCASGLSGLRPLTYREPAETRVFVSYDDCEHTSGPNVAPLIATIALGAASKLLEGFGTALTRASEGGALPSSIAATNFETPRGVTPRCLIIVRGAFEATDRAPQPVTLPSTNYLTKILNLQGQLADQRVQFPAVYELHHYIELQVLRSTDDSALSFAPVYTHLARSMDGSRRGQRELSIAVRFDRPGRPQTGSVVLVGNRQLGASNEYPADSVTRQFPYEAAWFSSFHMAAQGAGAAPEQQNPSVRVPVTVTTTVIETRPTREFLAFVASVFNGSRSAIEGELKSAIDPVTGENEARSALEAQASYATQLANARNAVIAYCALDAPGQPASTASERNSKSAAARNSQLTANRLALVADLDPPFQSGALMNVSANPSPSANPGRCS